MVVFLIDGLVLKDGFHLLCMGFPPTWDVCNNSGGSAVFLHVFLALSATGIEKPGSKCPQTHQQLFIISSFSNI